MAVKKMNLDQFLEFLKKQQGSQTGQQFATRLGVSPQYLSDVYNGRRPPGESITAALKVQKAVVFTLAAPSGTSPSKADKKAAGKKASEKKAEEEK
jgi:transcriptional regulator with XRE-family HTH domain